MTEARTRRHEGEAISVDHALARVLSAVAPLPVEDVSLVEALGLAAARDIVTAHDVPPFRNSAMDGFAVRSVDASSPSAVLRIIGESAAGRPAHGALEPGGAVRIMTGAAVPDGADAVVRFEDVGERDGSIELNSPVVSGQNIRHPGEDIPAGAVIVRSGSPITTATIGALAAAGLARVPTHRRPRVAILSTGDEIVAPGTRRLDGMIWDANGPMLASMARQAGATPRVLGIARDNAADIRARLAAADEPDLIVTSGGVSVGDYDIVKDILRSEGTIGVWRVAMKPGHPLALGRIGTIPVLGLPGNPVAAYVAFLQFGWPAILRMLGFSDIHLSITTASLLEDISERGGRRVFLRGVAMTKRGSIVVRPVGAQGSAMLSGLAEANCLIVLEEDRPQRRAGDSVRIQWLPGAHPIAEEH